jgi:predicted GIY-YIG superfamily endonuclease
LSVVQSLTPESNRDRRWREPAAVYRLWDEEGRLLYIGSAYEPEHRCAEHRKKPWWCEVARRTEEWHSNRGTAYVEEMKAIAAESPWYNVMGTAGYVTPQTEAIKRRKALAGLRQRLVTAAGKVRWEVQEAAREAGFSDSRARRFGALAEIDFLERTDLFAASVKRRRERLAMVQDIETGYTGSGKDRPRAKQQPEEPT